MMQHDAALIQDLKREICWKIQVAWWSPESLVHCEDDGVAWPSNKRSALRQRISEGKKVSGKRLTGRTRMT